MKKLQVIKSVTRFVDGKRISAWETVKCGLSAGTTSSGVRIYDPLDKADGPDRAEWFPFRSPKLFVEEV